MADSTRGTLAAGQFSDVIEALERTGVEVTPILAVCGLSRGSLRNPFSRFDAELDHRFWSAVERVTGDPAIALREGRETARWGRRRVDVYIAFNSGTLRKMFQSVERFAKLTDDRGHVELVEHGTLATARIYRDGGYPRAHGYVEALFSGALFHFWERVPGFQLLRMRLLRPRPKHVAPYVASLGILPDFDSTTADITFERGLLDVPIQGSDIALGEILKEHANDLLRKLPAIDPLLYSVQTALFHGLERGQIGLSTIARATGTSTRTLRRRLSGLGTSFHEQRDRLRHDLAVERLRRGEESVAQIADRLGFASTNAFQRAFRRWTGVPPSTYRQRGDGDA